ncbi:medium-chain acyl-CoA ligase ACSF2, mitochondrial-like isoform X1 [Anneissia japonica]|uniref:medium-chain acyl-CoA ligase ACSF2, mitochondrial-like isoform X1 n=1 Tax=Anneissia japonica TaxID=1529436 RepID=UPI001425B110|nr:medium-chain acyl-CoA ligase ACSF2, mitochondrial-like isoform X1 [Anneissia japonica]
MEVPLNISYVSSNQSSPLIGLTLHQLLEKRVNEHPDREIYVFPEDGERITFKVFKDRVEKLAAGLLSIGIKKGDRLALWGNIHMETLLFVAAARSFGVITVRILPAFPNTSVKDILLQVRIFYFHFLHIGRQTMNNARSAFNQKIVIFHMREFSVCVTTLSSVTILLRVPCTT